jgi:LacI family transcriptional regulator
VVENVFHQVIYHLSRSQFEGWGNRMPNRTPHRVTIRDVASDAGLSISTVSRVLSGARAVAPDIAGRVRESADRLGYRVDSIGRSLRTQRTNTIGLVVPDITNPFFPALVQAIEHAARDRGFGVLIADADNDPDVERSAVRTLVDRRVDAILISPTHLTASLPGLAEAARVVRTIQIDRVIDETLPFVRVDQVGPVASIVQHLRTTGRRHIAFIGQQMTITTSLERERAFRQLVAASFPAEPPRVLPGRMSAESGQTAAHEILASWPETDAIVCANDLIAVGVLQELDSRGARSAIAVSGFDDTMVADALDLTSVRQPVEALADAAVAAVADMSGVMSIQLALASEVIFRGSTA